MTDSLIKAFNPFTDPVPDVIGLSKRTWVAWLRSLFAMRPVGNYRWLPNATETEIHVLDQGPYNAESSNSRPAVITVVGAGSWSQGALSQKTETAPFPREDPTIFLGMSSVSLTLNVLAREGEEARKLAYLVYRLVPVFEAALQRFGIHGVISNLVVGQETPAGALVQGSSASEWKMVPIQAPYFVKDALELKTPDGVGTFQPMLRAITMQMTTLLNA